MGQFDTGSLDLLVYAAAPMPVPLLKKAIKELKCKFAQVFGMTETSPVTHILIPEDHVVQGPEHLTRRLGSVGRPIISVKSKIVDDNGNPCPPNVVGEIVDSGETVMKGYYKMPEATAETIKDGWLYTGDMGFMDEYGYFYLKDRKKDMIISGGENIYPVEVEMCIFEMEQIADVAVIGVPDETWGESVMALVVLNPGAELTEADVIEHCRKKIASYKKPKIVKFMEMLPKNSMGKTQKNILRQQHARS
jgi:fatty-acyl-CoA synthase